MVDVFRKCRPWCSSVACRRRNQPELECGTRQEIKQSTDTLTSISPSGSFWLSRESGWSGSEDATPEAAGREDHDGGLKERATLTHLFLFSICRNNRPRCGRPRQSPLVSWHPRLSPWCSHRAPKRNSSFSAGLQLLAESHPANIRAQGMSDCSASSPQQVIPEINPLAHFACRGFSLVALIRRLTRGSLATFLATCVSWLDTISQILLQRLHRNSCVS